MKRHFAVLLIVLSTALFSKAQDVFKTPSGSKYHQESCRMVKNVSEKVSLEQAHSAGLTPCKICKPAQAALPLKSSKETKGEASSAQCKGITRKGTRCLHRTRIGDGYCYQHKDQADK
jgi:hypothetical protein